MLLIFGRASSHVPLKILSIEDGTVLKSFNHLLHRNKKVDFIEQFNEKLLVKQENENLQILDVRLSLYLTLKVHTPFYACVWLSFSAFIAGPKSWPDRSKQNRIYDSISLYFLIWESVVLDISESDGCRLELQRGTCYFIWRPPVVAPWLQHQQHLYHKRSGSYYLLLQGWFWWFIIGRKW